MVKERPTTSRLPAPLIAVALALTVWILQAMVERAIGNAACVERATFELVSCLGAPPDWQWVLFTATAIGLAVLLGTRIRDGR